MDVLDTATHITAHTHRERARERGRGRDVYIK